MEEEQRNNRSWFTLKNMLMALVVLLVVALVVYVGKDYVMPTQQIGGIDIQSPEIIELTAMTIEDGFY